MFLYFIEIDVNYLCIRYKTFFENFIICVYF